MSRKITLGIVLVAFVFLWTLGNYSFITGFAIDDFFDDLADDDLGHLDFDADTIGDSLADGNGDQIIIGEKKVEVPQKTQNIPKDVIVNEDGGFCGDSIRQFGEDCSSCPTDVKCSSNAYCDSGVCIPKKEVGSFDILYTVLIVLLFVGISITSYIILRKIKKKKVTKVEKKEERKEINKEEKEIGTNYTELEKYIENALRSGYEKWQIKETLVNSDWKEEDVDFVLGRFNQK